MSLAEVIPSQKERFTNTIKGKEEKKDKQGKSFVMGVNELLGVSTWSRYPLLKSPSDLKKKKKSIIFKKKN